MTCQYSMHETSYVAKVASREVEKYLRSFAETLEVLNVEDDPDYRKKDIDLVWLKQTNYIIEKVTIEVKGDRLYKTGNYFFETISNESKNTPGCFLYTEADYIYYYFLEVRELHILPMPLTRKWFFKNIDLFREAKTSTPVSSDSYVTVGRLVPRKKLLKEIPEVEVKKI